MNENIKWLSTNQAAEFLDIDPSTLRLARSTKASPNSELARLPYYKYTGRVKYKLSDILDWLKDQKRTANDWRGK